MRRRRARLMVVAKWTVVVFVFTMNEVSRLTFLAMCISLLPEHRFATGPAVASKFRTGDIFGGSNFSAVVTAHLEGGRWSGRERRLGIGKDSKWRELF